MLFGLFQNILLQILPIDNGSSPAMLLRWPMFNIIIVAEGLPSDDEIQALKDTDYLMTSIALITSKHVNIGLSDYAKCNVLIVPLVKNY